MKIMTQNKIQLKNYQIFNIKFMFVYCLIIILNNEIKTI